MFFCLLFLFVVVPVVELQLLIAFGNSIGWFEALLIILLTGMAGAALARQQGHQALFKIKSAMARGEMPAQEILDGVIILICGVVLMTPGFITDAVGFLLLIPPVRAVAASRLKAWCVKKITGTITVNPPGRNRPSASTDDDVIDVKAQVVDDSTKVD